MDTQALTQSTPNISPEARRSKWTFYFTMITAVCSVAMFLILLIVAVAVVPKALKLMGTAQTAVENIEEVSNELSEKVMALELADAIKNIEETTTQAMTDVSESMEKIQSLDVDTLNESIQDLKKTTDAFKKLFGR